MDSDLNEYPNIRGQGMSSLWKKWYKVEENLAEIAHLKKKLSTSEKVLMDSATDMSILHERYWNILLLHLPGQLIGLPRP